MEEDPAVLKVWGKRCKNDDFGFEETERPIFKITFEIHNLKQKFLTLEILFMVYLLNIAGVKLLSIKFETNIRAKWKII